MTEDIVVIARDLKLPPEKVQHAVELLDAGNTIPFIARFRKDQTGGLDPEQVLAIKQRVSQLRALAERKTFVLKSIESQGLLNEQLANEIRQASSSRRVEDLYLPFKAKKQTLALTARQQGLEPLADEIISGTKSESELAARALDFVRVDKGLSSVDEVMAGVGYLIAEKFSERSDLRRELRRMLWATGTLCCKSVRTPETIASNKSAPAAPTDPEGATNPEGAAADLDINTAAAPATPPVEHAPGNESIGQGEITEATAPLQQSSLAHTTVPLTDEQASSPAGHTPLTEVPPGPTAEESSAEESSAEESSAEDSDTPDAANPAEGEAPPAASADEFDSTTTSESTTNAATPGPAGEASAAASGSTADKPLSSKGKEARKKAAKNKPAANPFADYEDFSESLKKIPNHRILAINRGERAGQLKARVKADQTQLEEKLFELLVPAEHPSRPFLLECARDAFSRMIFPSLEREVRRELTETAEQHALRVFSENLKALLLQPPVRGKRILAIDPGYKSGCAVAVLDEQGAVLHTDKLFVVGNQTRRAENRNKLAALVRQYHVALVAVGNGTACREAEQLVSDALKQELADLQVRYVIVNEAGTSTYSTSEIGKEELPSLAAGARCAVSIGRRLLDPLSELVKISPANLGVGLYQHDIKAKHLAESLEEVVEACVNHVGVNINTASVALLRHIAGLNQLTARRLLEQRAEKPFTNRQQLREVSGIGDATFVQAAGFLRIFGGDQPLDETPIHPESYPLAERVLAKIGWSVTDWANWRRAQEPARNAAPTASVPVAAPETAASAAPGTTDSSTIAPSEPSAETNNASAETTEGTAGAAANLNPAGDSAAAGVQAAGEVATAGDASGVAPVPAVEATADLTAAAALPADQPSQAPSVVSADPVVSDDAVISTDLGSASQTTPEHGHGSAVSSAQTGISEPATAAPKTPHPLSQLTAADLALEFQTGELLVKDILEALQRPTHDPRSKNLGPVFRSGIIKLEDLQPEMQLDSQIVNVVDFGVFVDVGLGYSCLVHVSELSRGFVRDLHQQFAVGDVLTTWVKEIDAPRRRVKLTAIPPGAKKFERRRKGAGGEAGEESTRQERRPRPERAARGDRNRTGDRPARGERGARPPRGQRPGGGAGSRGIAAPSGNSAPPKMPRRPSPGKFERRPIERPSKPKPAKPISEEMLKGEKPMRSFSDLAQFFQKKKPDDDQK